MSGPIRISISQSLLYHLLLPLARQLQAMKIDITNFMPWAEYVHEYAVTQNTDLTTSAYNIVKNLRAYKQLF